MGPGLEFEVVGGGDQVDQLLPEPLFPVEPDGFCEPERVGYPDGNEHGPAPPSALAVAEVPDLPDHGGHLVAVGLGDRFAEELRLEKVGMPEEVEFDAVDVVSGHHVVEHGDDQAAHGFLPVVEGRPAAGKHRGFHPFFADDQFGMFAFEGADELVFLARVVGVVHAQRPEDLLAVLVAEVRDDAERVGTELGQFIGQITLAGIGLAFADRTFVVVYVGDSGAVEHGIHLRIDQSLRAPAQEEFGGDRLVHVPSGVVAVVVHDDAAGAAPGPFAGFEHFVGFSGAVFPARIVFRSDGGRCLFVSRGQGRQSERRQVFQHLSAVHLHSVFRVICSICVINISVYFQYSNFSENFTGGQVSQGRDRVPFRVSGAAGGERRRGVSHTEGAVLRIAVRRRIREPAGPVHLPRKRQRPSRKGLRQGRCPGSRELPGPNRAKRS